ncbi:MAG: hypothetical protein N3J91_10090 [Verrucomicrobiae bacterium]|nr:hypothetical protein [Verrucomicrobiae bacterium]
MSTQLCLMSGEIMPNVIGVLHARSEAVLPVVTRETQGQLDSFERALRAAGSSARLLPEIHVLPYDMADCMRTLRQAMGSHPHLLVNWTGGTKIMSYAARRVAEELRLRALYVNTASREILMEELEPQNRYTDLIDSSRLNLNVLVYLSAGGHRVEGANTFEDFRQRCSPHPALVRAATFILDTNSMERTDLYRLAEAENQPYRPRALDGNFLHALTQARLIQPAAQPREFFLSPETLLHPFYLQSPQKQNAAFLRGTFIEVFLWDQIKSRSAVDDVAWHVVLNPGETGRIVELDLMMASDGRFLVLECKTHVELNDLADLIEEQYARTRQIGRLFGQWVLYIHRHRDEFNRPNAAEIIRSQEQKARHYGGRLMWQDDLPELPIKVSEMLVSGVAAP